jgi:haloalkane dehalogenase
MTTAVSGAQPAWLDREAYPFGSHMLEVVRGQRMHYVDEGSGPVLLFVHGTPTWSYEWRHLIRALSARYRCVAPDLLGMGLSDRPREFAYTPEAHSEALAAFVNKLGLTPFTLIVHDFGGPIGLPLALQGNGVERVVLLNTWAWSFQGDAGMETKARFAGGALGRFLYRWANASLRLIMPSAYADRRKLTPQIYRQYLEVFKDRAARVQVLWSFARALLGSSGYYAALEARLPQLRDTPALIVWGVKDSAFPPYQLARWRKAVPHARVVELPVGHWPHEEAPADVIGALTDFLQATGTT